MAAAFQFPDRVYVIAELSANHGGSLDVCLQSVRAAADAGADAIKVQTYRADTITLDSDAAPFQIAHGTLWDGGSLYELYKSAEMPWEWHAPIQAEAKARGIEFFSSPFDATAVDLLETLQVRLYKIASFEIVDIPLIRRVAATRKPVIISTGIADLADIEAAVAACRNEGTEDITLLKCTSAYPAEPRDANLLTIPNLAATFGVRVGLSDHTMDNAVAIASVALGARVIEKHFILDRSVGGPDAAFSLSPVEFTSLVRQIRTAEDALGAVQYGARGQSATNRKFARSLFATKDIKAGEPFTADNVRSIRPGDGLHPRHYDEVLTATARTDLARGTPLNWRHIA